MSRRILALIATSLLASGALAGLGASPAAAAAGTPTGLLTAGQPCWRDRPGPSLSPARLNDARAVALQATYSGDTTNAEVDGEFEVWDVAHAETRQLWRDGAGEESRRLYIQLEDESKQLHGVTYAWRVRVLDGEDASPWSDTCYYTVDRVGGEAPAIASELYPAGAPGQGGFGLPGTFTLTSPSDDTTSYEYRFTASAVGGDPDWLMAYAPTLGDPATITYLPTAAGGHSLTVYAVDRAGNRSAPASHDFWVRDTRPEVHSTAYPPQWAGGSCCANLDYNVGVPGEFEFDGTDDTERLEWRLDQGPSGSVEADDEGDAVVEIAPTQAGVQTLYVRGVTAGGTEYPERTYQFVVDNGPTITGDVDLMPFIGSAVSFHATPRTPNVVEYDYWLFSYSEGGGLPRPVTVPAKADGTADFGFTVTDSNQQGLYVQSRSADGALSVSRWVSLAVDGAAPSVTRTGGDELGTTAGFVARTDMANVAEYTVQFNGDEATKRVLRPAADGSVKFEYTPAKIGYQYLHIWATNTAGVRTDSGDASWNVSNGPKVTSAEFPAAAAGRVGAGTFTFAPRLPVATWYEYTINNGTAGRVDAKADGSATLDWTPPAAGAYTLLVRSYNGSASSQQTTYKFRVAPVTVKITSVSPAAVTTGAVRTITVKGVNLHLKDVLQVTPAGGKALTATIKSVSADGATMTADVNLTGAPAGAAAITLRPYGSGQPVVSVPKAFTVSPLPKLQATKRPTISGTVAVGGVVKATTGTWTPAATGYRYQWAANGVAIKGATGASLTVPAAAVGKRLTVTVTASRTGHTAGTAVSASTAVVAKGKAPKATKKPTITGTPKAGKKLTANVGTWSPKVDSYRYEWRVGGKVIKGATGRTLTLRSSWRNQRITVTVITKKAGYADGRATSTSVKVS